MNDGVFVQLLVSGIVFGTPLLYAGLGELLAERSGVMNLGVEGMMLMGAVTAFWVSQSIEGSSFVALPLALAAAAVAGGLAASIHALMTVSLRANQVVSGLALGIACGTIGLSSYLGETWGLAGEKGHHAFQPLNVLGLADLPLVGPLLFGHTLLVYAAWALTLGVWLYLYRTNFGLHLRSVGEDPDSADAMGINVIAYRYVHTIVGGMFAGIAGAAYSLSISPSWTSGMTAGAGWIAIALVIFAFWRPGLLLAGALFFGVITSLGFTLQAHGVDLPPELFNSLPYLMTIIVLVLASSAWAKGRFGAPEALGEPYSREGA